MMFTSVLYSLLFLSFRANADSDEFIMDLQADDSATLKDASLYVGDDGKFYIANVTTTETALVLTNGSLHITDHDIAVGIGKNYLSLAAESASYEIAEPWSIVDGYLKLYGSDFHAVPSGEDDTYVLGSINAAVGRDDMIEVSVRALNTDNTGATVADYNVASSASETATEQTGTATSSATTLTRLSSTNGAPVSLKGTLVAGPVAALLLMAI
ncbi:unnamed protein product [Cyberlindnera jadinii]|uniref:Uncharacterized protein n=1 Tax=Cyberlindnera jadinii (strain ATCC 18201 / CBS 1600 / BCRC 20928 / JCM 3617 / NBRC 0987 / NRRL Y-1542) TaxID=983966 RepID=A0A0H5CBU5_CYBJN|nr:unnamed protein product [Cyberlindnera jadinii]